MGELTGFDLGGELDSSSDFLEFDNSYRRRKKEVNILDDRSDGEIGPMMGLGESIGELNPSSTNTKPGKTLDTGPRRPAGRVKHRYEGGAASAKKDKDPLGQTMDYDGLEGSASYDGYTDEQNDSPAKRGDVADRPIYVRDDPVPKPKTIGGRGGGGGKVFASGESFGPLKRSSGGV